jgi:hypothetical protein
LPEFGCQGGSQLCLPIPNGFGAEDASELEEHLAEILERETIAQSPEHHQGKDVARILGPVQHASIAFTKLPATVATTKAPVTLRRAVPPFQGGRSRPIPFQVLSIRPGAYPRSHRPATQLLMAPNVTKPDPLPAGSWQKPFSCSSFDARQDLVDRIQRAK